MLTADGLRRLLWYLISGTRGGIARGRIISALKEKPMNANQLAGLLQYDYTTVRHHLDVLKENGLIITEGNRYAQTYFLSPFLDMNYHVFTEIWERFGKTQDKPK